MKHVWKYLLQVRSGSQEIEIPEGATLLHAAQQSHGEISLWFEAIITEDEPILQGHWFQVFGTGHAIPEPLTWVATTPGLYVWHVYEDKSRIYTVGRR